MRLPESAFALVLCLGTSVVCAADWPQWRGPFFNGATDEVGLPTQFSRTENVAWSADLSGAAASTPIVSQDHVFLSGIDAARDTLLAQCFDRHSGRLLWQHDVARGIQKDDRSNYASSSPVTDGKLVVFFFGSGQLACYDLAGKSLWARDLRDDYGEFAFLWTFSSSPLLLREKLFVQVLQRDEAVEGRGLQGRENESYLLALDPPTGRTLWRHVRPSEAVAESREAFTTPVPCGASGHEQLLVAGGDALSAHDPDTGKELWRWGNWNPQRIGHWRLVTSPVAGSGVALVCGPKGEPVYAVKTNGAGALDDRILAWTSDGAREVSSDVPTPAYYDGDFFVLSDVRRQLSRVESTTGKVKWTKSTPGRTKYEASPLAADGKIYVVNFDGQVAIFRADNGELVNVVAMDEPGEGEKVRASVIAAHGQLFIRTTRKLYCVGKN
jgi:outer membrane protein assembly factor BamB